MAMQRIPIEKKSTPVCRRFAVPCVARLVRRLRNSRYALRQSSPKSPDQPALLRGAQGIKKQKAKTVKQSGQQVARQTSRVIATRKTRQETYLQTRDAAMQTHQLRRNQPQQTQLLKMPLGLSRSW